MKVVLKMLIVGGIVGVNSIVWAPPASACIPDDPNCVRRVLCVAGDTVNAVTHKLGYGEPVPCD